MKTLSLLIFCLPFLTNYESPGKFIQDSFENNWFEGVWEGMGYQIDGQEWKVVLRANSKNDIIIQYPDLNCGGSWQLISEGNDVLKFKEHITEGVNNCDQGVDITIKKLSETQIKVTFYLKWYSENLIAEAILDKIQEA